MAASQARAEHQFPGLGRSWWPMFLLFCSAIVYSIDKGIVGVLAEPIRRDFAIGDTEMGLLLGLAYSLLSGVLGLGLGHLVDRSRRFKLLGACILLWSGATIGCGFARGFGDFFMLRMLVGLGEAALAPAAVSLIADMFAPGQRGKALSSYLIGASIGSGLSSIIPGWLASHELGMSTGSSWRSAFMVCGALGIPLAVLLAFNAEPQRRGLAGASVDLSGISAKLARLWSMRRLVGPLFGGFCLFYVALIGITSWTAVFIGRRYGLALPQFGPGLGLMLLVSGMGGYMLSGFIVDLPFARRTGGRLRFLAVLPLLALPSAFAQFAPSSGVALVAIAAIGTAMPAVNIAMNATIQDIMPNDLRGFSHATLGLLAAFTAGAGGPLLVARVGESAGIGMAFLIVGVPVLLAANVCFVLAGRALELATSD
jgi:MFS family permease